MPPLFDDVTGSVLLVLVPEVTAFCEVGPALGFLLTVAYRGSSEDSFSLGRMNRTLPFVVEAMLRLSESSAMLGGLELDARSWPEAPLSVEYPDSCKAFDSLLRKPAMSLYSKNSLLIVGVVFLEETEPLAGRDCLEETEPLAGRDRLEDTEPLTRRTLLKRWLSRHS